MSKRVLHKTTRNVNQPPKTQEGPETQKTGNSRGREVKIHKKEEFSLLKWLFDLLEKLFGSTKSTEGKPLDERAITNITNSLEGWVFDSTALSNPSDEKNKHIGKLPEGLSIIQLADNWNIFEGKMKEQISNLPAEQKKIAEARLGELEGMVNYAKVMKADKWKPDVIEKLVAYRLGMKESGITERLPEKLTSDPNGLDHMLIDENNNNKPFDDLRGPSSTISDVNKFMQDNGGDLAIINEWFMYQATDSWSEGSQAMKSQITSYRNVDQSNYFYKDGKKHADQERKKFIDSISKEKKINKKEAEKMLNETTLMWMAFNMELLEKTDLPGKNAKKGTITIYRTENKTVLENNGITEADGKTEYTMKRGPIESGSIIRGVSAKTFQLTRQEIPYHRCCFCNYLTETVPGKGETSLLSDYEMEFLFMGDGIPFTYVGDTKNQ